VAQQIAELENQREFKLSTYYFLSPSGHEIQGNGIVPDYVVHNFSGGDEATIAAYLRLVPMAEKEDPVQGDTGLNVYGAQQRLAFLGYGMEVTGTMDENTTAAVKRFQTQEGMAVSGVLDASTRSGLEQAAYNFAYKVSAEDEQLKKAVELLAQ